MRIAERKFSRFLISQLEHGPVKSTAKMSTYTYGTYESTYMCTPGPTHTQQVTYMYVQCGIYTPTHTHTHTHTHRNTIMPINGNLSTVFRAIRGSREGVV